MGDGRWYAAEERLILKIVVTGGPATGKTSFVGATRNIAPAGNREGIEGPARVERAADDGELRGAGGTGASGPGSGRLGLGGLGEGGARRGEPGEDGPDAGLGEPEAVPGESGTGGGGSEGAGGGECVAAGPHPYGPVVAYEPVGAPGERGRGAGTVALDFGRIALRPDLTLCLFGVPGLEQSVALCEDMCAGALGAVVLVDTGRLAESFALVDRLEERALPFVVVMNRFAGPAAYRPEQVASALGLSPGVPVLAGDVREATTVRHVLAELVAYTGRFRAARLLAAVSR